MEPGTRFDLLPAPRLDHEQFASLVAGDCTSGFELFPKTFQGKQFSLEASENCESFEQQIASEVPGKLSFEFGRPEAPLKLVAWE